MSAAEQSFLKRQAEDQVRRWVEQLSSDFSGGLEAISPSFEEIELLGRERAYRERLAKWTGERGLFSKNGAAVPDRGSIVAGVALLHYTRKTRELAAMQLQFVAGVSHELRTPLTVITGAAHNLLSGVVREPKQVEKYDLLILDVMLPGMDGMTLCGKARSQGFTGAILMLTRLSQLRRFKADNPIRISKRLT